jgi:hypothetical protein
MKKIKVKKENIETIKETLYEEIKKRDAIIDELKKQNEILLKTALKNASKRFEEEKIKEQIK